MLRLTGTGTDSFIGTINLNFFPNWKMAQVVPNCMAPKVI